MSPSAEDDAESSASDGKQSLGASTRSPRLSVLRHHTSWTRGNLSGTRSVVASADTSGDIDWDAENTNERTPALAVNLHTQIC